MNSKVSVADSSYKQGGSTNKRDDLPGIFITKIPLEMTHDDLCKMLNKHGDVQSLYLGKPKSGITKGWAIARISNKSDMLNIINSLNKKPPLYMSLTVALSQEERNQQQHHNNIDRDKLDSKINTEIPVEETFSSKAAPVRRNEVIPQHNNMTLKHVPVNPKCKPLCCVHCNEVMGTVRCSVCMAWYCSKSCQVNDWYFHNKTCKPPPPLHNEERTTQSLDKAVQSASVKSTTSDLDALSVDDNNICSSQDLIYSKTQFINYDGALYEERSSKTSTENAMKSNQLSNKTVAGRFSLFPTLSQNDSLKKSVSSSNVNNEEEVILMDNNVAVEVVSNEEHSAISKEKKIEDLPCTDKTAAKKKNVIDMSDKSKFENNQIKNTEEKFCFSSVLPKMVLGGVFKGLITSIFSSDKFSMIVNEDDAQALFTTAINDLENVTELGHEDLTVGSAVAVNSSKFEGWTRGFVYEIVNDKVSICLVDFGDVEEVSFSKVKCLPSGLCQDIPAVSLVAKLYGSSSDSDYLATALSEKEMLTFKIVGVKQNKVKIGLLKPDTSVAAHFIVKSWISEFLTDNEDKMTNQLGTKSEDSTEALYKLKMEPKKKNVSASTAKNSTKRVTFSNCLEKPKIDLNKKVSIQLAWVTEENVVSAYKITETMAKELKELQTEIIDHCSKSSPPDVVNVGDFVCAFLPEDDLWYRALVLKLDDDDKYKVKFVDFGNEDTVNKVNIRSFNNKISSYPIFVFEFGVNNLSANSVDARNILLGLITEETSVMMEPISKEPLLVNLFDTSGNNIFSKFNNEDTSRDKDVVSENLISSKDNCCTGEINGPKNVPIVSENKPDKLLETTDNVCLYTDCQYVSLKVDQEENVVILKYIDPSTFFVTPQSALKLYEEIEELSQEINKYCASFGTHSYKPSVSEVVLAKYSADATWYRASCIEVLDNSAIMLFADYANIEEISFNDQVKMSEQFLKHPLMALECGIKGIDETNSTPELSKRLAELLPENNVCKVKVVSVDDSGKYMLSIPEIK